MLIFIFHQALPMEIIMFNLLDAIISSTEREGTKASERLNNVPRISTNRVRA